METELEVRVEARESGSNCWETTCWGCKLQLTLPRYSPIFKCGYCGAVNIHETSTFKRRSRWELPQRCNFMLDHVLVTFVVVLVVFIVGGGVWTTFPILFPSHSFGFFFHSAITGLLVFNTIYNFVFAAFIPAGPPPSVEWGQVEVVERGGLENYKFCAHCQRPKHPAAHHCRTCRACVMEMDHHCPFIGNCVGANNHRFFILFLVFTMLSCLYVFGMTIYTYNQLRMSTAKIRYAPGTSGTGLDNLANVLSSLLINNEVALTFRYIGLLYLSIISSGLLIAIGILLHQQLAFVYQGQTYLDSLSVANAANSESGNKGWTNLQRFFNKRRGRSTYLGSFRWTKLKQTAWKLALVAFLAAVLVTWRNEQISMRPIPGHERKHDSWYRGVHNDFTATCEGHNHCKGQGLDYALEQQTARNNSRGRNATTSGCSGIETTPENTPDSMQHQSGRSS